MLPLPRPVLNGIVCEHAELLAIHAERLRLLDAATALTTLEGPLPVRWRTGWTCTFKALRRGHTGALLVELRAMGPGLSRPYTRKVRLVPRERLPIHLGLQLRES